MVLKSSFDPKIVWQLPEGPVPYKPNDVPEGTEHTMLSSEANRLYHLFKVAIMHFHRIKEKDVCSVAR